MSSDNASDFEVDAVETMMEYMKLQDTVTEVQKTADRVLNSYKTNFLNKFLDNTEKEIDSEIERQKEMLKMPEGIKRKAAPSKAIYVGEQEHSPKRKGPSKAIYVGD